jgi:enoyl-CoA hydratase
MTDTRQASSSVLVEERGAYAIVRLANPARRNALSHATLDLLDQAASALIARPDLQAIIFTGADDVFASGADIRELQRLTPATAREFAARGQRLFHRIADAPQTTIAAINGYCMGGGLDLALACKLRYAAANAIFAHPGASLGIITGWGGTQRLPRLVGTARALEMFLTARLVTSDEALAWGLVNRICDPVLQCACEAARSGSV